MVVIGYQFFIASRAHRAQLSGLTAFVPLADVEATVNRYEGACHVSGSRGSEKAHYLSCLAAMGIHKSTSEARADPKNILGNSERVGGSKFRI